MELTKVGGSKAAEEESREKKRGEVSSVLRHNASKGKY